MLSGFWFVIALRSTESLGHYLNQCWNIVKWVVKNKLQWNFNRNVYIFIRRNACTNIFCKMGGVLSRPPCIKDNQRTPGSTNIERCYISHGNFEIQQFSFVIIWRPWSFVTKLMWHIWILYDIASLRFTIPLFRPRMWLLDLWCLVPWIGHLPPACLVDVLDIIIKWQ